MEELMRKIPCIGNELTLMIPKNFLKYFAQKRKKEKWKPRKNPLEGKVQVPSTSGSNLNALDGGLRSRLSANIDFVGALPRRNNSKTT